MTENAAAVAESSANAGQAAPSPLERRVEMIVTATEIEAEVAQRLKKLSRTVKMAGFRPGKVPMKMVEQAYGPQARNEALGAAVERAFGEQVRAQNLRVAGYPRIEPLPGSGEGKLMFSAVFEVYPTITLGDISTQSVEKPVLSVGEAEVDKTIQVLRTQRVTFAAATRPSQKDDRLLIDFVGRKGGEEFQGGRAENYAVMVGGGAMLPDFEKQLEGVVEGHAKSFDVSFPDDYHAKDLAGATVQFDMTVRKVESPVLPEVDAAFAKALGIVDGDLAKMRDEVKSNLEREVKKRLQARIKNQIMEALLVVNPLDVPNALVDAESQQMAENAKKDMESRGMAVKNLPVDASWFKDQATRRVKLGLLLSEIVRTQGLQAKPEQVRAIVDDFAETFEDPREVVRWYYSDPQRLAEAEALAVENNVVDWVLGKAAVTDKAVTFDELMGNAA